MVTFRGIKVYYTTVHTALSKSKLPDLDYALNPYLGCGHGCVYCYARLYTKDRRASENWGFVVVLKTNIVNVLSREVKKLKPGVVGVGTITDAYQPVEAVYKLTSRCLKILLEHGFRVSIQTKNPLVLRDLNLLAMRKELVDVGFTITTLNGKLAEIVEPRSPPPGARVQALRKLSDLGIKTWIFYGPIVPGLNDDEETVERIAKLAHETASTLYYDPLNIKPFMKNPTHPLRGYISMKNTSWWVSVKGTILKYCDEYALTCKPGFLGNSESKCNSPLSSFSHALANSNKRPRQAHR